VLLSRGVPTKEVSESLGASEMQTAFAEAGRKQREKEDEEKKIAAEISAGGSGAITGFTGGANSAIPTLVN